MVYYARQTVVEAPISLASGGGTEMECKDNSVYKMLTSEPKTGKIMGNEWFLSSPESNVRNNQRGEEHEL
jgi:hypothetical protein